MAMLGVDRVRAKGGKVARAHLTHLNPFPKNLGDVLRRYPKVLVPEMNLGQLSLLIRAKYLVDAANLLLNDSADEPIAPNDTADGRARNRRVEIKIVPVTQEDVAAAKSGQ